MKLATAAQMREMDRRAINDFGIPSIVLMENAARQIADEIVKYFPESRSFAAVCGPGNNGGDGIAAARHLTARYGWQGTIWLCEEEKSKFTPDRQTNLGIAEKMGIPIRKTDDADFFTALSDQNLVVIDALLGTGFKGEPRPAFAGAIRAMQKNSSSQTVCLDLPSGVDVDTGAVHGWKTAPSLVITLAMSKIGLHLDPASKLINSLVIADLCFPKQLTTENSTIRTVRTERSDVADWLPKRTKQRDTNKSTFGAVALFCGSPGFAGAATLSTFGASRAGAGLVTLGIPDGLLDIMMARVPDTVMTRGFAQTEERAFHSSAVANALEFVAKMDAVGIGPGIGQQLETRKFVTEFVAQCAKPMVIDADALNCLSLEPDQGASIIKQRNAATLLTPHPGEMARLLGISSKEVQADRLGSVRQAAEKFGCIVLLKGNRTLVASPEGWLAINETGNSGMASGGMGDVLTGIATTFLAQIENPFHAAIASAFVHGLAGDIAAESIGEAGLLADDLAHNIPKAIARCFKGNEN